MTDKDIQVGVVIGSDSDLPVMQRCLDQLKEFDIAFEVRVISAHRTPDEAHTYAATAIDRGLKLIIAAAGMSAALAGVLAAKTTLPIIGVPMDAGGLDGLDAMLSTMQMPHGVPVGCMSIGKAGAINAAIYAAEILATADPQLRTRLEEFKQEQVRKVTGKDQSLRKRQ